MSYRRDKRSAIKFQVTRELVASDDTLVVMKGSKTKSVDLNDLRQRLKRLKQVSGQLTGKLTGQLKEDFDTLKGYVSTLYENPEYKVMFEEVKKQFIDLKNPKVGTVGAYFAGCLITTEKGCSLLCNGAMPKPRSENGFEFCNYPVVWATFKNGKYDFTVMNRNGGKDCVIYMESPQAYGFSNDEKKQLRGLGFVKAQMIHAPLDGKSDYKHISQEFIDLERLPGRGLTPIAVTPVASPVASPVNKNMEKHHTSNGLPLVPQGQQPLVGSPVHQPVPVPVQQPMSPLKPNALNQRSNTSYYLWLMLFLAILIAIFVIANRRNL